MSGCSDGDLLSAAEQVELCTDCPETALPAWFEMTRRDLFSALGPGLLILVGLVNAGAQESGGQRRRSRRSLPQSIGAWLHIAASGGVTAYTGKAEVGQNIRTSLSQAVADELRIGIREVSLVMGDTGRTPYDMGTFGSRTTPTMAPQLRRASAAARELMLNIAAEQWKADRTGLRIANGTVTDGSTGRSARYGQLLGDRRMTETIVDDVAPTSPERWIVAGHSAPKVDGPGFVTGAHQYASDVRRDGMLYARIVRPPAFHSKLRSVDAEAAKALPRTVVVHEADFIAVAAPTTAAAERAAALVRTVWDTAPQAAGAELFSLLHPGATAHAPDPINASSAAGSGTLKASYKVAYIAHAPLEPRAAVAEWHNGLLTVWTGTQRPFGVRSELASAFGIEEENVRVIVPDTGSGYGGKHTGEAAVEAARIARAAGKPVKLAWTREEEFTWAYFRPAGVIEIAATMQRGGALTKWEFDNFNSGSSGIESPYAVADRREDFHESTAPLRQGSYRGLASTANNFARESHMDDMARLAGTEPLAFRLKNSADPRLDAVLEAAAKRFGWEQRKRRPNYGFGIAAGHEKGSYVANCVEIVHDVETGSVRVVRITCAFECGAIVNPLHLKNQVEGGTVMGIGGALFEAIHFDSGKILNPRFSAYRVPRFRDIPPIDVVLLDRKDISPAGAGETPLIAIAPALRNAILDATGLHLRDMPLAPRGVKS